MRPSGGRFGRITGNADITYIWCNSGQSYAPKLAHGDDMFSKKMSPLEDLYLTRTQRNRDGMILDEWNHVLLLRDLDRLVSAGIIDRVKNFREISRHSRDMTWYRENSTE